MQYNTPASNTMFVKVRVKPTNKQVFQLTAHFYQEFTSNNALCMSELPIGSTTTLAIVQAKIESFRAQHNAQRTSVSYQAKVIKLLTPSVA
jgi:hypothetical protein